MAKKEITAASSPAEVQAAAEELRQARQELQTWIQQRRVDPNTPRDIFEGVDYGPLITVGDIQRQQEIIAVKYDYVDFGTPGSTTTNPESGTLRVELGTPEFFVPGAGSDLSSVTNSTVINNTTPDLSNISSPDGIGTSVSPVSNNTNTQPIGFEDAYQIGADPLYSNSSNFDPLSPYNPNSNVISYDPFGDPIIYGSSPTNSSTKPSNNYTETPDYFSNPTVGYEPGQIDPGLANAIKPKNNSSGLDDQGFISAPYEPSSSNSNYYDPDRGPGNDPSLTPGTATTTGGTTTGGGADSGSAGDPTGSYNGIDPTENNDQRNGNFNNDDVDVSTVGTVKEGNGSAYEVNVKDLEPRANVLHNYANWTYNVGLYMLTPSEFNSIVDSGSISSPPAGLLIKSGGTGTKGALGGKKDYYIENLKFTSICGQNSRTAKSSNNFEINFEIVEPYGVAFMAELIEYALSTGVEDHFDIPYLLEIDFKGYEVDGTPKTIPDAGPKYIPIQIVNMQFKVDSAQTVYTVTAVPYAHSPIANQHDAFIQESISLKGDTFQELIDNLFAYLNNAEQTKAQNENRQPNNYSVIINDSELSGSQVGFTHVQNGSAISVDKQTMDGSPIENVQINGNSTLKSAIQSIANATDFGAKYNTVGQPESGDNADKPYRLLKIIPVVKLGQYNTSTKQYQKDITYKVETQKLYGFITPGMPAAKPTQRGWLKEYNWIFTGENKDILDFSAEYNVQYFNIRNAFVNPKGNVTGTPAAPANPVPFDNRTRVSAGGAAYAPGIKTASSPVTTQIYNSYRGGGHQLASDHMDNVLNNPSADMMIVNLSIIGDPDWIAQDYSVLPNGTTPASDSMIVNGSIATDKHDVFVMLRFKTPRDYDPIKGLMQMDTEQTFVQGLYRVLLVRSTLEDGKFSHELQMVRVQNQLSNDSSNLPDLGKNVTPEQKKATALSPFGGAGPNITGVAAERGVSLDVFGGIGRNITGVAAERGVGLDVFGGTGRNITGVAAERGIGLEAFGGEGNILYSLPSVSNKVEIKTTYLDDQGKNTGVPYNTGDFLIDSAANAIRKSEIQQAQANVESRVSLDVFGPTTTIPTYKPGTPF